ncbi:MAG TPA: VWA domain-containing protein [Bryobacteraceae bacterium]|jgi:Ca-activated chloride channel family protein|nr:VWA domain-containing protein [Bryobacteraceae bacterium]
MCRWFMPWALVAAGLPLFAQGSQNTPRTAFRANAELVLVPVTVLDRQGRLVNGLRADSFRVFDDRISERIFAFSEQDVPASVGVILDMSGSMKGTLSQAKFAVRAFLDTANPEDEAFLYSVSSRPNRNTGFAMGVDTLLSAVALSGARGSTALVDTMYCGLDAMRSAHQARKALLIISDGMDNNSRYSKTELLERALESDVQIYTIALYGAAAYEKAIQLQEERQGLSLLEELAAKTGGLHFVVRDSEDMSRAAMSISRAIRNEYTIAYVPGNTTRDGRWHSIQVKVGVPGLKIYARSGYYAQ